MNQFLFPENESSEFANPSAGSSSESTNNALNNNQINKPGSNIVVNVPTGSLNMGNNIPPNILHLNKPVCNRDDLQVSPIVYEFPKKYLNVLLHIFLRVRWALIHYHQICWSQQIIQNHSVIPWAIWL